MRVKCYRISRVILYAQFTNVIIRQFTNVIIRIIWVIRIIIVTFMLIKFIRDIMC
jgi:hypothetical protein